MGIQAEDDSSSSTCDTNIPCQSLQERFDNGRVRQTVVSIQSTSRIGTRRSNHAVQKKVFVGLVLVMAIADLASMMAPSNTVTFGITPKVVTGFSSSPSHLGRRSISLEEKHEIFPSMNMMGLISERNKRQGRKHHINTIAARAASSSVADCDPRDAAAAASATTKSWKGFWVRLLTGEAPSSSLLKKPKWLPQSSKLHKLLPSWIFHLRPSVQVLATVFLYLFHTTVLTQNSLVLPFELLPNDRGNFQSIGLDT